MDFPKTVIWMILSKKAKSYVNLNFKVARNWTARERRTDSFRVDNFMVFAELYIGFLKWPWLTS